MRRANPQLPPRRFPAGFTLPAVLMITVALLLLAVGLISLLGIERRTAISHVDFRRAELAARAGMEEFRATLNKEAANDDFLIIQASPKLPVTTGRASTPNLFLARGKAGAGTASPTYRYLPLFSATARPDDAALSPTAIRVDDLTGTDDATKARFVATPSLDSAQVAWVPVQDEQGRMVARYAYWVEDMQSRLDATTVGNTKGTGGAHARNVYPFPAPGINPLPSSPKADGSDTEPTLDRVALYALDPASPGPDDKTDLDKSVITGRPLMLSPDSVLAAASLQPPLTRDGSGHLVEPKSRALEENTSVVVRPYDEQPLVPYVEGVSSAVMGLPKKNLNALAATGGDSAVSEMAKWIDKGLPDFTMRKGGFPDDYLSTLSANALSYVAPAGSAPLVADGSYRGLGCYPLVSEFLMKFRWDNVLTENNRKYVVVIVSTYVELWNMTDQPVAGNAELSYETQYTFPLGANPEVNLSDPALLDDPTVVFPKLAKHDGRRWFAPFAVSLRPNEYKVIKAGDVTYKLDAGPSSIFISSPLQLDKDDGKSGYRLNWQNKLVDQARGLIVRNSATLNYPTDTTTNPRQKTRTTIPAHSCKDPGTGGFIDNMGDPRMSYYLQCLQDANAYPDNYSPNRRNIRWGTIYSGDAATKPKVYGRVLPSEWPDGGHDSAFGSSAFYTTDQRINPDDRRFLLDNQPPAPRAEEAPMKMSTLGRFYSVTELGRVYDPVMWTTSDPAVGMPWPDVSNNSAANGNYGGGNTLRIGRPEHPKFDVPGRRAARLLDLFHVGKPRSNDKGLREGALARIEGHININTASRESLRALAAGWLGMDPILEKRTSLTHETTSRMAAPTQPLKLSAPTKDKEADLIADAIILRRPYASPSQMATVRGADNKPVFGNRDLYPDTTSIFWSDSAAEEMFSRVHDASTVRSRNFRVWVVAQSVAPTSVTNTSPEVLAEARKQYTLFADPGTRKADGAIDPDKYHVSLLYENGF